MCHAFIQLVNAFNTFALNIRLDCAIEIQNLSLNSHLKFEPFRSDNRKYLNSIEQL